MTDQTNAVARKVRERREALGLSVRQAASLANITRATWADVEAGRREHVRGRTLDSIAKALRLTPGSLASIAGTMVHDSELGDRRITVLLESSSGDSAELLAREQLVHAATALSSYDVQRVLTYIDRLPPPPDLDRYVREAVSRAIADLMREAADGSSNPLATAKAHSKRKVS